MNASTRVRAREDDPVEVARRAGTASSSGPQSSGGAIGIIGASIGFGAERLEQLDELRRLFARPRDEDALAEQRPRVEPAQVLAQRRDAADDEDRRPAIARVLRPASQSPPACRAMVSWVGSVPS